MQFFQSSKLTVYNLFEAPTPYNVTKILSDLFIMITLKSN